MFNEQARQIRERLARDNPTVTEFQRSLAGSHNNLGNLLLSLGKRQEARTEFEAALSISEQLVDQFGNVIQHQINLGGGYCNYGELLKEWGELGESLTWFDKAIQTLNALYEKDQRVVNSKQFLANSLEGRSQAYYRLKRYGDAIKDLDSAVELKPLRNMALFRSERARTRAHTDQTAEALAEAIEVATADGQDPGVLFNLSCTYAILSAKMADNTPEYADRAMELLNKAVAAGYDKAGSLAKDADLDPLRERDDFKKMLAELNEKHPPAEPAKRP